MLRFPTGGFGPRCFVHGASVALLPPVARLFRSVVPCGEACYNIDEVQWVRLEFVSCAVHVFSFPLPY
jgi:hypothetical protein